MDTGMLFPMRSVPHKIKAEVKPKLVKPQAMRPSAIELRRSRTTGETATRFVRDPAKPEELENIRYNLIRARVMSGLTEVEAAARLGYANSTQLNLIESGKRRIPDKHQARFLTDFARAYSVSVDFLLGLSPHMEPDGEVAHGYAMARHMADVSGAVGALLASTMREYMSEAYPTAMEYRRIVEAIDRVDDALSTMRGRFGFDDVPGGAPLARAIEHLTSLTAMLRPRLSKLNAIEGYMADMRRGMMPEVRGLCDEYNQLARQTQHELPMGDHEQG